MATGVMVNPAGTRNHRLENGSLAARLLAWLGRLTRVRGAALETPLHAEARLSLGPKKSLVLVNCCGRRVLLGLAGDAIVPLGEVESAPHRTKSGSRSRREAKS
jgi:flagellar biogenesis protein FliO